MKESTFDSRSQGLIPANVLGHITSDEISWLMKAFESLGGRYPSLEELWELMDKPWQDLNCDTQVMDDRITEYYRHPVWLLNGLFIEQHDQSLENRRQFSAWVANQVPKRVADYGGGYGTLARMIGTATHDTQVEVIEPHPHPAAISLAKNTANVRYQPTLSGQYDILIATDVFEHVPDPLALVADVAQHLKQGGQFLIANCFYPVIKCHLPSTFHFRWSWDTALRAMGFSPGDQVCYGESYRHTGKIDLDAARQIENRSRRWYPLIDRSPRRLRARLVQTLIARGK